MIPAQAPHVVLQRSVAIVTSGPRQSGHVSRLKKRAAAVFARDKSTC